MKKIGVLVFCYQCFVAATYYFRFRPISFLRDFISFIKDYFKTKSHYKNENFKFNAKDVFPCLHDKLNHTPLDPVYFYQDSWAASKIFQYKPITHVDVGSAAKTIGILSQFVPITMIDIRPVELKLKGLSFMQGSILNLPFADASLNSISSLCVIEHIGLGRYGDPLDGWGSEKAIKELQRVTAKDGIILFSVPVDKCNKIYFNAHRAFTREYITKMFNECILSEEKYIYDNSMIDSYLPQKGYGIGLYMFIKK